MRKTMILLLLTIGLLGIQSALAQESSTPAQPPAIPERSGYLNDQAGVLKPNEVQQLEASLGQVQQQIGTAIYILTVNSTRPTDIVSYTHQVADAWGLNPDSTTDRWVFILVAVKDGTINIADSQAVSTILPDAALRLILEQKMKPAFDAGKFALGLAAGVQEIVHQLVLAVPKGYGTSSAGDPERYRAELLLLALVGVLAVAFYFLVIRRH